MKVNITEKSNYEIMQSSPSILVAVINYNQVEDTIETLKCLANQKYPNNDLIIFDNASTNDCNEKIAKVFPEIPVVHNHRNNGYAGAINDVLKIGFDKIYDAVIICNNDIFVEEHAIERMMLTTAQHENAGIIGGIEIDYYTNEIRTIGGKNYNLWTSRAEWSQSLGGGENDTIKFNFVQGAMILFTSKALHSKLFVDENLFMYGEEADMGFQLKALGLNAYVNTNVKIYHKAQKRYLKPISGYYQQRNRIYLLKKYGKWYHIFIFYSYLILFELPIKILIRSLTGHHEYAWACTQGFWDGIWGRMGAKIKV